MRLILIRHGQTPSNVARLLDTAVPGPGLTALGREQADAIPGALAGERIDAVFASNQLRAQQTAAPLAAARGVEVDILGGLREVSAGDLEMASGADAAHRYIGTLSAWLGGDDAVRIPGGPNGAEVVARFDAAVATIERVVGPAGAAAAVSHGAVLRVWAGLRTGDIDDAQQHLANTAAIVLDGGTGAGWHVVSWGTAPVGDVDAGEGWGSGVAGDETAAAGN